MNIRMPSPPTLIAKNWKGHHAQHRRNSRRYRYMGAYHHFGRLILGIGVLVLLAGAVDVLACGDIQTETVVSQIHMGEEI